MNVWRFSKWLIERKYTVTVFCIEDGKLAFFCKKEGFSVIFIKKQRKYYDLLAVFKVSGLIKSLRINVMCTTNNYDLSLMAGVKWKLGNKISTVFFQGMQFGMVKRDFLHTYRYKKIDAWLAPLPWLQKQVLQNTRIPEQNVHLLPLGLELDKFMKSTKSKQELRAKLGLPGSGFIAGIIGRIDEQKGQLVLLQSLLKLPDKVHALFVGDKTAGEADEYENKLLQFIETNQLADRIHFKPHSDYVEDYFRAMDVFVMASKKETFGLVTIEAMACGTAVVGTNTGGTFEILGKGQFGLLFEPDNSEQLAEKIGHLNSNPEELVRLGAIAQEQAANEYSHTLMMDRLEQILKQLQPLIL